jgi:predicted ATPase
MEVRVLQSYRFGRAELRPDARQLFIDGHPCNLGGRAFDMLQVLIERRGRLVKKAELLDLVWPGLIVEENNLQVQMSHLRKLLGPTAIATIPGRGYRFDATVEVASGTPAAGARAEPPEIVAPATRLLGREADLAAVADLCSDEPVVTILGAGGIGKTRVARAFAQENAPRYPDGIVWVDLAVVTDSATVPAALATALGITLVPKIDPFEAMLAYVGTRKLLIVIDNAEHLADAVCRTLRRLLQAGPALRVLVTSQQPLRFSLERIFRLEPLAVPRLPCTVEQALSHSAVALLCERVTALDLRFRLTPENLTPVVRICQRLDGVALAIELAAARLPLLGAQGLLEHLDSRFDLLTSGDRSLPLRQHTLRATVEWSHALLTEDEKRVRRRVAISFGGFDLDLARHLASEGGEDDWTVLDALGALVERSWVNVDAAPVPRYTFAETARGYALLTLHEAGEFNAIRRRHGEAMWRLMERAFADFWTTGDETYVARYAPELDNFRAAMGWAREAEPMWYVSMTAAAIPLLRHLSLIREGVEYLAVAEGLAGPEIPLAVRARLAMSTAMLGGGRTTAERAVELHRQHQDDQGLYISAYWVATRNEIPRATVEEMVALKRRVENPGWPPKVLALGRGIEEELLYRQGRYADAVRSLDRRIVMCEAMGARDAVTSALMYKVIATFASGDIGAGGRTGAGNRTALCSSEQQLPARLHPGVYVHRHAAA